MNTNTIGNTKRILCINGTSPPSEQTTPEDLAVLTEMGAPQWLIATCEKSPREFTRNVIINLNKSGALKQQASAKRSGYGLTGSFRALRKHFGP